jgi:inositol-phosphate phosphatase/L-galactose 1-phosphate phosphatase/histidinol-phosphatase
MTSDGASASPADAFIDLAIRLADTARPIARRYFRSTDFGLTFKADCSPVTLADKEIESAIRAILTAEVPKHGIFGEEYGTIRTEAGYVWTIDPIDGTNSFATGKPLFGTLISLTHGGIPVLGIIDQAILDERWLGVVGRQTTLNGLPVQTRACSNLADAWLSATTPDMFTSAGATAFNALKASTRRCAFGSDCYAYGLLASGFLDIVCEADLKPYDYCALAPVVAGAGGTMTDWQGQPLRIDSDGRVLAAGDAVTHALALATLAGALAT